MSFTTTLQKALNASHSEIANGVEVLEYDYPGDSLDDLIQLILANRDRPIFPLQQQITVNEQGKAEAQSTTGNTYLLVFAVKRPLQVTDL